MVIDLISLKVCLLCAYGVWKGGGGGGKKERPPVPPFDQRFVRVGETDHLCVFLWWGGGGGGGGGGGKKWLPQSSPLALAL